MSVLEGSVSCVPHIAETHAENNNIVNSDSASVLDAETVQNTNTHNSHVEEAETVKDSELLKGLLTDTFCQVCEAVLLFESQRVSHYEGKKHAQRVRVYLQTKKAERKKPRQELSSFQSGNVDPEKFCELCNMVFSSPVVARSHYEGKVHAKNWRKSSMAPSVDVRTTAESPVPPVTIGHGAPQGDQEQKGSPVLGPQGVDLGNPEKYCKLCTASFNNPLMAQQHYSGRKHQRNQARQELLGKLGEKSEHVHSLTCPVCCVTLSSIETYQAHMQGNKHHVKEKKIVGLCKSQKKVYDSFQDELADYIEVQRARGLEPKTAQGPEAPAHRTAEEEVTDTAQDEEEARPSAPLSHAPPPSLPAQWHTPFHPRITQFAFRGKFPMQKQWNQGYTSHPPPLIPGLTGRSLHSGRSPDSSSSSSFSDSDSSFSSSSGSSSISSSEDSRESRRRRRKRRDKARSRREQDDDSVKDTERRRSQRRSRKEGEEERGHPRKARRQRRMSFEEEQGEQGVGEDTERRKVKRPRDSEDSEDYGRKRRVNRKSKNLKEGHSGKRWREEDEGEWSKVPVEERVERGEGAGLREGVAATPEAHLGDTPEPEDERTKCRREKKKKTKDKMDKGDTRTEEEKLWDETILGLF